MTTTYEGGQRVGNWSLEPIRVFGGYRVMWERWRLDRDGWDQERERSREMRTFKTEAEAREAIATMNKRE